ncbi:LpxI family protein [Tropicibacter naphthalenivorans]|uniref:Phosphatidate cytidylyltransferase n=1 Tax=Tropicibacter naphthalenivorans TaxID=441103 RepID=A0A0P1GMS0_9RHOB|nr:UDP-2,3-diacylglucosamine diphosphatase LpxI [Tropicibacter naphthalenivorans]CUH77192.1 hypothetical protein TRN7648_01342 [Tropicibacter naphthalenivorans]SMC60072.1 hypothetical protein SAMN04488093_102276 [Tropicibacter naphthalenivorans]
MLALIAGTGELPRAVVRALPQRPLICALETSPPDFVTADRLFRLEHLGSLLRWLRAQGVTQICMCGAVSRPDIRWQSLDLSTVFLLPSILRALRRGDDGALRIVIGILEGAGFDVLAAHEAVPALLLPEGIATRTAPGGEIAALARLGDRVSAEQAREDLGQACVIRDGQVLARETDSGTDKMLGGLPFGTALGGVLYKAPKPGQDRRADLPVIGPQTAARCAEAGLKGIIIEAGGVMVLDQTDVIRRLDAEGMFLWVRERPSP